MITNWHTTHIEPGSLSRRLKTAYVLWLWVTVNHPDELPSLDQIQSSDLYQDLSPYIVIAVGQSGADASMFTIIVAGSKVEELFGKELTALRFEDILTKSGQALAEETVAILRKEHRPVHLSVAGSSVVSDDLEVIQMPLRHNNPAMEMALLMYNF